MELDRREGETWRDVVVRYAKREHMEEECLEVFDRAVKNGMDPAIAAFHALYEWDCAPLAWGVGEEHG